MLILTIGTGHNGTNSLNKIMKAVNVKSIHEPYMSMLRGLWGIKREGLSIETQPAWVRFIAKLKWWIQDSTTSHIAMSAITPFCDDMVKIFGDVKFILPIRKDKRRLIMVNMHRGTYTPRLSREKTPKPNIPNFERWPLCAKCAWFIDAMESLAMKAVSKFGGFTFYTEDIAKKMPSVLKKLNIPITEKFHEVAAIKHHSSGTLTNEESLYREIDDNWKLCQKILRGEYR